MAVRGVRKRDVSRRQAALWGAIGEGTPLAAADDVPPARLPAAPRKKVEAAAQRAIVARLRRDLPPQWIVFSVPNHARSPEHRWSLIAEGMLPGMVDVVVLGPGPCVFGLETKRPLGPRGGHGGSIATEAQRDVHERLRAIGAPCAVVRGVDDAVVFLRGQGAPL